MKDRLVIGSAQFGMNYGINNKSGQVVKEDVFTILDYCLKEEILEIDTSYLYNDSEYILGQYHNINKFRIVSKSPSIDNNIEKYFFESLNKLSIKGLYGYLVHHFDFYKKNPSIWNELQKLKEKKYISKIGFSLYYPYEFEYLIRQNIKPDIIQIPYNIFDQRFDYILNDNTYNDIEFYTRSAYLQGLFFIKPENLTKNFKSVKHKIESLNKLSKQYNKNISELCLGFVLSNQSINKVIIGLDNLEQLKNIINLNQDSFFERETYNILKSFKEDNEMVILPFNWN